MFKLITGGALLLCSMIASAQIVAPPSAEVTVVAERPGPRLWRVTDGSHSLLILGTQTPLPQRMKWRSAEVETVIAGADEVFGPYSVALRTDGVALLEPKPLKQVLPRKVYARWTVMRDRYIDPQTPTENLLPAAAALYLQAGAYEHAGLTSTDDIWLTIYGLARFHHVPLRSQAYEIERKSRKQVNSSKARQSGIRFLVQTMDRLEADIATSSLRANAWADGDLAELRRLAPSDESYATSFARSWPFLSEQEVASIVAQEDNRLASVFESALHRNRTTFAALPVYLLMKRQGVLSILDAAGYQVVQPDD